METLRLTWMRYDSSTPPLTKFEKTKAVAPALSLPERRIDRSTHANSFEVTVALWHASTGCGEMADLRGSWVWADSSVCRLSTQLTGRFSRHRLSGILLHKIFRSDCNVPFVTPDLVKRLSSVRACTTFLPLQALKVNVSQSQGTTSTVWF